jgi:hypothetical protein
MKILFSVAIFFCGLFIAANVALSQTWIQQTNAPNANWMAIACSADGTKLVAVAANIYGNTANGHIYSSTNSGVTWTVTGAPVKNWLSIASSADGVELTALGSDVSGDINSYTSTNTGNTWATNSLPTEDSWSSIASSADGTKLVAAAGKDLIWTSTNSGAIWTQETNSPNLGISVASSADGTKLIAGINGGIYASSDSGATWTSNNANATFPLFNCVASSADGRRLQAGGGGNSSLIYSSTNSGATWASNNVPRKGWLSIASSADGSKLIAGCNPAIYTSINSGTIWISNSAPGLTWESVATSADGSKLVAVAYPGGIWTLQTTPIPQLNLATSSSNLAFSWIVPSTNFVLQENLNLTTTNWVTLTNTPTLNLINLQNEIMLCPSNSSGFFRLMAQ